MAKDHDRHLARWAHLRFCIIGPLLAAPPPKGELWAQIEELAQKGWQHPSLDERVHFAASTIERWYYAARAKGDPVGALDRRVRKDAGTCRAVSAELELALLAQYRQHPSWSYKLHVDNLVALAKQKPELGLVPSYSTLRRFMKERGLLRRKRLRGRYGIDAAENQARFEARETRSYESEYVSGLWHSDFHHGSRKVLMVRGDWVTPIALCFLDDCSRLGCHLQWYRAETAETFCHGLCQALLKRGLCRELLTDNGSQMCADEIEQGLLRLGIMHPTTLPRHPQQNGKQEVFWAQLEGRLLAMLEGVKPLTLELLNQATQAWVELEYNRSVHSEIGQTPLSRFLEHHSVGRPSPSPEELKLCFRAEVERTQRHSDGTFSLEGVRFEVPARYRHWDKLRVRYAGWDLGAVHLCCPRTGKVLAPLYPLDRVKNGVSGRRELLPVIPADLAGVEQPCGMAPLLAELIDRYQQTGLPPAYLPERDQGAAESDVNNAAANSLREKPRQSQGNGDGQGGEVT